MGTQLSKVSKMLSWHAHFFCDLAKICNFAPKKNYLGKSVILQLYGAESLFFSLLAIKGTFLMSMTYQLTESASSPCFRYCFGTHGHVQWGTVPHIFYKPQQVLIFCSKKESGKCIYGYDVRLDMLSDSDKPCRPNIYTLSDMEGVWHFMVTRTLILLLFWIL